MPLATPPSASIPLYARSKVTGETFLIGPPVSMIDDLGDVDTSTTGPTGGSALVWDATLGQWVPGAGGLTISTDADNEVMLGTDGGLYSNEVHLGPTGPTLSGPDLWADPEAGVLYAAATGPTGATEWVAVGGSEVEVDGVEPGGEWELWADTSTVGPITTTVGIALDDLTDVDLSLARDVPAPGDALVFDSATGLWLSGVPAVALNFLTDVNVPTPPADNAPLVYDTTTTQWVAGAPATTGMHQQDSLAITAGSHYFFTTMSSGGDQFFDLQFTARSGNSYQSFHAGAWCGYSGAGTGKCALLRTSYLYGTKMFDAVVIRYAGSGARLCVRAAWTGTVNIGWELKDTLNGAFVGPASIALDTVGTTDTASVAV